MELAFLDLVKSSIHYINEPYCFKIFDNHNANDNIVMEKGFYFMLVINGTAVVSDVYNNYILEKNNLLIFTPSVRAVFFDMSREFLLYCLYIVPDYFDSLSVGLLLYNRVSHFIGNYELPVFHLEKEQAYCIQNTLVLSSGLTEKMLIYRDGAVRHLCSFLMLQMADVVYMNVHDNSGCVKRSNDIFRKFKKLLVHNYRKHHDIKFYACNLNISTTYLSRVVKNLTGHTVNFHISELLCADARKMLECSDLEVKEIADVLGFSDQSVFGKFFRRKTGMSPMKFRMRKSF